MTFKPGISGNPKGRPKKLDPRSQEAQVFVQKHKDDIQKIGEIVLKHAIEHEEPWAIKLGMEYFYPKPGACTTRGEEETREDTLAITETLSPEDQRTFLQLWMKTKKTRPMMSAYA